MEYLTIKEVCAKLKCSQSGIYKLISEGKFPTPSKGVGNTNRWSDEEIDAHMANQKLPTKVQ